ncbi:helix-turn-helix domain-containing protein [Alteromonas oceanisediminis]|uniref:helix-turn-helix domain-containing protein n=1 Tax=Alteromonas oceanisediminis TaxID=2836180 RepID=UPI001BD96703|nr:helix-turn-helix domain-containing protein [Alteromonas oceanisediminis]MBT0587950.1 AraC family transcriptional regulator [Alteromonas oceanisediminis]
MQPVDYLNIGWRSTLLLCLICPICLSAFTLILRKVEAAASLYLGLFLLIFCLNAVPQVIGFAGFYQAYPWLTFAPFNNELWLGPLLLLHTLKLTKRPVPRYVRLLFISALIQTSYYTILFLGIETYQDKFAYSSAVHNVFISPIESICTVTVSLFCCFKAFLYARRYTRELLDLESDQESFDVSWLTWMAGLVGTLVVLWSTFELFHRFVEEFSYPAQYPFHLIFLAIIMVLGQKAVSSIRLPFPEPLPTANEQNISEEVLKETSLIDKIKDGLEKDCWYLRHQFSLSDMARALGSNETYISKAINVGFGKNFSSLINEARVNHAKRLIQHDPTISLSDLMHESGFNSKASFNRSFKLIAGITPSAYQLSLR